MATSLDEYTDVRPLATFDEEWKSTGPNNNAASVHIGSGTTVPVANSAVASTKTPSTRMPSESKYAVDDEEYEDYELEHSKVMYQIKIIHFLVVFYFYFM